MRAIESTLAENQVLVDELGARLKASAGEAFPPSTETAGIGGGEAPKDEPSRDETQGAIDDPATDED